ncbi:MAG: hypothetical protein HQK49_14480 [Oligoflexia bacterium]|nr:hypothetical protein [Oligoflexia bacterium]
MIFRSQFKLNRLFFSGIVFIMVTTASIDALRAQISSSDFNAMIGGFYSMSPQKGQAKLYSTTNSGSG